MIAKLVTPVLTLVAMATPPVLNTFVYGANPPIIVTVRVSDAPRHKLVVSGESVQVGAGRPMTVVEQELTQPKKSVMLTV